MNPGLPNPPGPDECERALLTQADFDGELDAVQAAQQAAHRDTCPACRAAYERLARVRTALRDNELYQRAPDGLRAAIAAKVAPPQPVAGKRGRARGPVLPFGLGAALAAGIALVIALNDTGDLTDRLVDDHVRALQPGHLEDVVSTDRHTVKPWFDGRIDFAPPVKDLADQQFPLKGGRLDYVDGKPVAAMVYEHGHHPINLFVWPASDMAGSGSTSKRGYNVVHWTANGMTLWAVSDLEMAQLQDFARLWQAAN